MSQSHTPGPWMVAEEHYIVAVNGYPNTLATVHYPSRLQDERSAEFESERQANARLIAASPNQNAALVAVLADWDSYDMVSTRFVSIDKRLEPPSIKLARAAVAKARGETTKDEGG